MLLETTHELPQKPLRKKEIIFAVLWAILTATFVMALVGTVFFSRNFALVVIPAVPFLTAPMAFIILPLLHVWMKGKKSQRLHDYLLAALGLFILLWFPLCFKFVRDDLVLASSFLAFSCWLAATYSFWWYLFGRKGKSA